MLHKFNWAAVGRYAPPCERYFHPASGETLGFKYLSAQGAYLCASANPGHAWGAPSDWTSRVRLPILPEDLHRQMLSVGYQLVPTGTDTDRFFAFRQANAAFHCADSAALAAAGPAWESFTASALKLFALLQPCIPKGKLRHIHKHQAYMGLAYGPKGVYFRPDWSNDAQVHFFLKGFSHDDSNVRSIIDGWLEENGLTLALSDVA